MSDGQLVSHGIDPFLEGFGCQWQKLLLGIWSPLNALKRETYKAQESS